MYDADTGEEARGIGQAAFDMFVKSKVAMDLFEEALCAVDAPDAPLVCMSLVVNGAVVKSYG